MAGLLKLSPLSCLRGLPRLQASCAGNLALEPLPPTQPPPPPFFFPGLGCFGPPDLPISSGSLAAPLGLVSRLPKRPSGGGGSRAWTGLLRPLLAPRAQAPARKRNQPLGRKEEPATPYEGIARGRRAGERQRGDGPINAAPPPPIVGTVGWLVGRCRPPPACILHRRPADAEDGGRAKATRGRGRHPWRPGISR